MSAAARTARTQDWRNWRVRRCVVIGTVLALWQIAVDGAAGCVLSRFRRRTKLATSLYELAVDGYPEGIDAGDARGDHAAAHRARLLSPRSRSPFRSAW